MTGFGSLTCVTLGLAVAALAAPAAGLAQPGAGPTLAVGAPSARAGGVVDIPIVFASNGSSIATILFSLDYDESVLTLDPADADGDDVPDAVTFNVPAGLLAQATFDPADAGGELDILVTGMRAPLPAIADGALVVVSFASTAGSPEAAARAVRFSTSPAASFGSTTGQSVPGSTGGGAPTAGPGGAGTAPAGGVAGPTRASMGRAATPAPSRGNEPGAPNAPVSPAGAPNPAAPGAPPAGAATSAAAGSGAPARGASTTAPPALASSASAEPRAAPGEAEAAPGSEVPPPEPTAEGSGDRAGVAGVSGTAVAAAGEPVPPADARGSGADAVGRASPPGSRGLLVAVVLAVAALGAAWWARRGRAGSALRPE